MSKVPAGVGLSFNIGRNRRLLFLNSTIIHVMEGQWITSVALRIIDDEPSSDVGSMREQWTFEKPRASPPPCPETQLRLIMTRNWQQRQLLYVIMLC